MPIYTKVIELFKNNQWEEVDFMSLKKGDRFRMFIPNKKMLTQKEEYIATSDPFLNEYGIWSIFVQKK